MSKTKELSAVTKAASLAARALERIEQAGTTSAGQTDKAEQSVRLVADGTNVSAIINVPGLSIRFQNGTFAIDATAQRGDEE